MITSHADATLTIHLDAIAANFRLLQQKAAPALCSAVIKADAYGLGSAPIIKTLIEAGCQMFFVATLDEALYLREITPAVPIYVLHGVRKGQEDYFTHHQIFPVLNDMGQLQLWQEWGLKEGKKLPAILHVDTGMNRLGLSAREAAQLSDNPFLLKALELRYIISHLVSAENPLSPYNAKQLALCQHLKHILGGIPVSLCNSSGIFLGKDYHFDMVRPGSALYGINPTAGSPNPMRPAITLTAKILQVREIDSQETVGYGGTYMASAPMRVAVIPVGYADGYLRALSNKSFCKIGDVTVPVIGRVSMDMITVDVSSLPEAAVFPGTEVEILGATCTVDAIAEKAGTIGYEVLTRLGNRFRREYKGS